MKIRVVAAAPVWNEIEFVCVNSDPKLATTATPQSSQTELYRQLVAIPCVVVLRQDWSENGNTQISLSALYLKRESTTRTAILRAAKKCRVLIDLEQTQPEAYVNRAVRGEQPNQIGEVL